MKFINFFSFVVIAFTSHESLSLFYTIENSTLLHIGFKLNIVSPCYVDQKTIYGQTPLYHARTQKMAKLLLARGAQVDAQDFLKRTALHVARNVSIAEVLLQKGANIDQQDCTGKTPLHLAVRRQDRAFVDFLLSHKARIDVQDKFVKQLKQ